MIALLSVVELSFNQRPLQVHQVHQVQFMFSTFNSETGHPVIQRGGLAQSGASVVVLKSTGFLLKPLQSFCAFHNTARTSVFRLSSQGHIFYQVFKEGNHCAFLLFFVAERIFVP